MEPNRDVITAAEVVLLIIWNEGELEDDMEYPLEFTQAYELLLTFDVIQLNNGKFLPSRNFDSAYRTGIQKFIKEEISKKEAIERRRSQNQKISLAIFSSAAIGMAGYFIKKAKASIRN